MTMETQQPQNYNESNVPAHIYLVILKKIYLNRIITKPGNLIITCFIDPF